MNAFFRTSLLAAALVAAPFALAADPVPQTLPEGYKVETIALPKGEAMAITGVDTGSDGSVWVCTREGDVWRRLPDGTKGDLWKKFAEGLQDPCGLLLERKDGKETGAVLVTQKPELTRLVDKDGDGVADAYQCVNATFKTSGNYHEFNHGLVQDSRGNLYGALNLGAEPENIAGILRVRGTCMMARPGDYRGTVYRVKPDGAFEVVGWGVRSPCGVGMTHDDHLLYTENQGDYMPSCFLAVVEDGQFYGQPAGLFDHPDYKGKTVAEFNAVPLEEWAKKRTWPAVWLPYRELHSSSGQPVEDRTAGKFGPFAGQIFIGDQTHSNLIRTTLQQVKGQWQGFAVDFINHTRCGIVRGAFDQGGSLWLGETGRGWGSSGDLPFALERVTWDGKTVPFCIKDIKLEKEGFRVSFTKPVDPATAQAAKVGVRHWTYKFTHQYGCGGIQDQKQSPAGEVAVSDDRMSMLVRTDLVKHRVYDIKLPEIRSADGKALTTNHGYYTLNETVD